MYICAREGVCAIQYVVEEDFICKILGCQNLGLLFCIEPRLILSCVCMCVCLFYETDFARSGLHAVAGGGGGPGGEVPGEAGADGGVLGLHEHHALHGRP